MQLMSAETSLPIPGKILIVDDKFETVKDAVSQLLNKGFPLLYWNGKDELPSTIQNIRAVVLDLNLTGEQIRGEGYYALAAESLHKIPGPHVTVIMSQDFLPEDPERLREAYKEYYNDNPPVIINDKGLAKADLEDPKKLVELIAESLKTRQIMRLVLGWEGLLDVSKDEVLRDLVLDRLESAMFRLVQNIRKEADEYGTPRDFVETLLGLLSRRMCSKKELKKLAENIDEVLEMKLTLSNAVEMDRLLNWLLMYATPDPDEEVRTGDIYKMLNEKGSVYGIVMTPVCDLVQGKTRSVIICKGCELCEDSFKNPECPLLTWDLDLAKKKANMKPEEIVETLTGKYLKDKGSLSQGLYRLFNFRREISDSEYSALCFHFKEVQTYSIEQLKKPEWKRVCRLDAPFIDVMLQHFGTYSSRIGEPNINKSQAYFEKLAGSA